MSNSNQREFRNKLHEVIFEADTKTGKFFDLVLMVSIIVSVLVVVLDSVADLRVEYGALFIKLEWFFTILFTIEYALRIISVQRAKGYIFSFYGLVDFFSILPTYLSLLIPGSQYF
jgi:voltage-gated potassium channel